MFIKIIQKKPILFSVLFFVFIFLLHKIPLSNFFQKTFSYSIVLSTMVSKLIFNTIIIAIAYLLCYKTKNITLGGLKLLVFKNTYIYILPIIYIFLMSQNFKKLQIIEHSDFFSPIVLIFFIKALSVGLLEEITFRSLFQSLIIKKYYASYGIYFCVIITSLLFGLGHIINLVNLNYSLIGVLSQVVMAFCVGFLFSSILIATQNIYPVVLIHALNHFSTFIAELLPQYFNNTTTPPNNSSILEIIGSLVITLLIFGLPTILPSIYILNKFKPNLKLLAC